MDWQESNSTGQYGYGILYNGFVFTSDKRICPKGWHLPTVQEMEALNSNYKAKQLKATYGWKMNSETGTVGGSDEFGFTFVAAGSTNDRGMYGMKDANGNIGTGIIEGGKHIVYQADYLISKFKKINASPGDGVSCRCILDNPESAKDLDQNSKKTGPVYMSLPDAESEGD